MNKQQAKNAYRLAYKTALRSVNYCFKRKPAEPFATAAMTEIELTEQERNEIWNAVKDDVARRFDNWLDDQRYSIDDYAETFASFYNKE